jgi:4-aminobutyrate aminotransferase-like enzyme
MFQEHGVVPDIVTFGKPMGEPLPAALTAALTRSHALATNERPPLLPPFPTSSPLLHRTPLSRTGNGYPVAAVVCQRWVADSFAQSGIEYFNTYGGNSVACAIAEAVLDTIEQEGLQQNALLVGRYLTAQLEALKEQYLWVGDVRGSGLFQGIEFVHSCTSADLQPYPELTKFLVDYLRYQKVLVSRDGPDENVIKVKPPLVFSKENVDTLVGAMREGLACAVRLNIF